MKIGSTISRGRSIRSLLGACALAGLAVIVATPAAADRLGSSWHGCEFGPSCEWQFEWRRVSANSNVFNGYWRHPQQGRFQGQITVFLSGTSVTVSRPALGGAPACTYSGTYKKRDVHNAIPARVSGTYTCGAYTGPWRATIRN